MTASEQQLYQAQQLIQAGERSQAVDILKQILREDSQNGAAWYWMEQALDDHAQKQDCANRWRMLGFVPPVAQPAVVPIAPTSEVIPTPLVAPAAIGDVAHAYPEQAVHPASQLQSGGTPAVAVAGANNSRSQMSLILIMIGIVLLLVASALWVLG